MSASITTLSTNQLDSMCTPSVNTGINTLPNEILSLIFSQLESTPDVSAAMLTCKRWMPLAEEFLLTPDQVIKLGLSESEYDPMLKLSAKEIGSLVSIACRNMLRIQKHTADLKNYLRGRFDADKQYALISHFFENVGLPIDEKGLIPVKLEKVHLSKKRKCLTCKKLKGRRILLAPELSPNPREATILLNLSFEDKARAINLFLTNIYLKAALYSTGKARDNTSKLLTQIKWFSFAKYTRASILALSQQQWYRE